MKIHPQRNFLRVHLFYIHNDIVSMATNLYFEKKFQTLVVNSSTNINKMNCLKYLSPQIIEYKEEHCMKIQVLFWYRYKNVAGFNHLIDPNNIPIKCIIKKSVMFLLVIFLR